MELASLLKIYILDIKYVIFKNYYLIESYQ